MIDLNEYPCPACSEHNLVDDGIVRWRSGERPSRSLAKPRDQLGTSPRADYDETAFYHCASCKTQFVDHSTSGNRLNILHIEGRDEKYRYDHTTSTWKSW